MQRNGLIGLADQVLIISRQREPGEGGDGADRPNGPRHMPTNMLLQTCRPGARERRSLARCHRQSREKGIGSARRPGREAGARTQLSPEWQLFDHEAPAHRHYGTTDSAGFFFLRDSLLASGNTNNTTADGHAAHA